MTAASPIELAHDIGARGVVSVRTRHGAVRLRGVEGTTVRIHGNGETGSAVQVEKGDGSIAISTGVDPFTGESRRRSVDLEIDVPISASVVVESASGKIVVEGLLGEQRYRTASGDVRLRGVAGRLTIEAVSGDVEATVVDDAFLQARTVSGDLALRAATIASLRASTTSGDLRIAGRLAGPGPFSIETVSGDALLALAGDVRVELRSVTGDLRSEVDGRSDGGRGHRSVTVGSGGPTLNVRSTSGDVRLVRPSPVVRPDVEPEAPMPAPGPSADADGGDPSVSVSDDVAADADPTEAARLSILRALERGEIDIDEATRQLDGLDGDASLDADIPAEAATAPADPDPGLDGVIAAPAEESTDA
jgi:hypothetical protein